MISRLICRIRGHAWSANKSSVNPGHWCGRCRRFLAPAGLAGPTDTRGSSRRIEGAANSPETGAKLYRVSDREARENADLHDIQVRLKH